MCFCAVLFWTGVISWYVPGGRLPIIVGDIRRWLQNRRSWNYLRINKYRNDQFLQFSNIFWCIRIRSNNYFSQFVLISDWNTNGNRDNISVRLLPRKTKESPSVLGPVILELTISKFLSLIKQVSESATSRPFTKLWGSCTSAKVRN